MSLFKEIVEKIKSQNWNRYNYGQIMATKNNPNELHESKYLKIRCY